MNCERKPNISQVIILSIALGDQMSSTVRCTTRPSLLLQSVALDAITLSGKSVQLISCETLRWQLLHLLNVLAVTSYYTLPSIAQTQYTFGKVIWVTVAQVLLNNGYHFIIRAKSLAPKEFLQIDMMGQRLYKHFPAPWWFRWYSTLFE